MYDKSRLTTERKILNFQFMSAFLSMGTIFFTSLGTYLSVFIATELIIFLAGLIVLTSVIPLFFVEFEENSE